MKNRDSYFKRVNKREIKDFVINEAEYEYKKGAYFNYINTIKDIDLTRY